MSRSLIHAAGLTPELRLAQAISEFKADLSQAEKQRFLQESSQIPSPDDVMRLTAEVDRSLSQQGDRRCFGPRLTNFLQGVQQFASIGDVIVGGSQFLPACGVWTLVRISLLSVVRYRSYVDSMSQLFMQIGRLAPSYQRMALLFPRSKQLQNSVTEYLIRVVQLCHRMLEHSKQSGLAQFFNSMIDSSGADRKDLEMWSLAIRDELEISSRQTQQDEIKESSRFRFVQRHNNESTRQFQKETIRLRILNSISTYDYQNTWKQLRKVGSTTVLALDDKYAAWKFQQTSSTLILTGQLGAGKSVVLSNMVDDLFLSFPKGSASIAYFFCHWNIEESLLARTIVGAVAHQLLKDEDLDVVPLQFYGWPRRSIAEVAAVMESVLKHKTKIYVILDGIHECDAQVQEEVLSFFKNLQKNLTLSLCISARQSIAGTDSMTTILMSMPKGNPDIPIFVNQELEKLLDSKILVIQDPLLILEIRDKIVSKSEDMFLWVGLQMSLICAQTSDHSIRQMLKELPLPSDLAATYIRLLNQPTAVDDYIKMRFLSLVMAAFHPLTTQELKESLSVSPGNIESDTSKLIQNLRPVLSACSGLLTWDEEQETVRLVHPSAFQFLQHQSHDLLKNAHEEMASTIFTYLSWPVFETSLSTTIIPAIDAARVPAGVVSSVLPPSNRIQQIAIKLLRSQTTKERDIAKVLAEQRPKIVSQSDFQFQHYARKSWLRHLCEIEKLNTIATDLMNRLISAEKLSLDDKALIKDMSVLYIGDMRSKEFLCWAIQEGCVSVVKLLLDNTYVDLYSIRGRSRTNPFSIALAMDRPEIVSLLLQHQEIPHDWGHHKGGPLGIALENEAFHVAGFLIESGQFDPNGLSDRHMRTTHLTQAVIDKRATTVMFLMDCPQVDNNKCDGHGSNALHCAIRGRDSVIFNLLISNDIDVNVVDMYGRSPLFLAVTQEPGLDPEIWKWIKAIMNKLLSNKSLDPNIPDTDGRTALDQACALGRTEVVRYLVANARVNLNPQNHRGETPLLTAMKACHFDISEILLNQDSANDGSGRRAPPDPNLADHDGFTPLHIAASHGSMPTVKALLQFPDIQVMVRDRHGRTAADMVDKALYCDVYDLLEQVEARQFIMLNGEHPLPPGNDDLSMRGSSPSVGGPSLASSGSVQQYLDIAEYKEFANFPIEIDST